MAIKISEQGPHHLLIENREELFFYDVRADGCVHIERFHNGSIDESNRDYLHICELDDFIKELEEVKKKAIEYYKIWPT